MTRKRIIISIVALVGILSVVFNALWLINAGVDRVQENATVTAQQQVVKAILDAVAQSGQVVITIPDKQGKNQSITLVAKAGGKDEQK